MTWFDHQHRSKKLAAAAQSSLRRGDDASARQLFAQAAQEADKQFTLGAIAMAAASLWRRANRSDDAARMARLIRGAPELFPITVGALDGAPHGPAQFKPR
jgi:hypothetical protein